MYQYIGNAYVNAETSERVYCIAGKEFGAEVEGQTVIIVKALYGLASSSRQWHAMLAKTLRSAGWRPTRYDRDVWIRLHKKSQTYEYITTYVDDFMIFSRETQPIMDWFKSKFTIKGDGPPDYYLGNDFKQNSHTKKWTIGCRKYIKDALEKIEGIHGQQLKRDNPCDPDIHLEIDQSPLLGASQHRQYQQLIGILNWIMQIGRVDIAYATTSLARFVAAPRRNHMKHALYVFGYLKKHPNRRITVDSRNPIFDYGEELLKDDIRTKMQGQYPEALEEIDIDVPKPIMPEMSLMVMVDSDHAHDKVSRRSITGMVTFLGRTPIQGSARRQGSIETSTYSAEFNAMRSATEEVIALRYMLRCLGVRVTRPTPVFGDNLSVITNIIKDDSLLKKKHVSISFNKTRECVAAGIIHPIKVESVNNFADLFTKALPTKQFSNLVGGMLR